MKSNSPWNLPSMFVKTTDANTKESVYLPIDAPLDSWRKLPKTRQFNVIQEKLYTHGDERGRFKKSGDDLSFNFRTIRNVITYLKLTAPVVTLQVKNHLLYASVRYPNGVVIRAQSSSCNDGNPKHGSIQINDDNVPLLFVVEHLQWPDLDLTSYVDDWEYFYEVLSDDLNEALNPQGISANVFKPSLKVPET